MREALVILASDEKKRLGIAVAESRAHTLSVEFPDVAGRDHKNTAMSRRQELGKAFDCASVHDRGIGSLRSRNLKLGHSVSMIAGR